MGSTERHPGENVTPDECLTSGNQMQLREKSGWQLPSWVEMRGAFSKILRHYCPGKLFFFPSEGQKVLASFITWGSKECTA